MRELPVLIFNSTAATGQLYNEAHFQRHLFKLVTSPIRYYTDCDQDIYFDSHYWTACGIKYSDLAYSIDQSITTGRLTIPNANKVFSDLSLAEDLRNKALTIYRVWLNNSLGVVGCSVETDLPIAFDGVTESLPRGDGKEVQINLSSFGIAGNIMCPRRTFEAKCPWIRIGGFKGTYCASTSTGTWCDGSKSRCAILLNSSRFGGAEYISDLQTKQVLWGQRVKTWTK